MDTRERMRLYIANLYAMRRAKGLCYRCGGPLSDDHKSCLTCRRKQAQEPARVVARNSPLNTLAEQPSTGAL